MFEAKYIVHVLAMVKTKEENTTKMVEHSERERERGDTGLFITPVPKVLYTFSYSFLHNLGNF